MKVDFIGGTDVQRTLNHSANKCVNLYPALNDKGDIAAFYGTPGLLAEATNPSSEVGSGIYTASNGRCFEVAGTTLYELTEVLGVITTTSRGTVTAADIYRMSDNGIELILVNGTDGWLFTFATNTLKKIKVASADFTVTIANPAVFTKTAHGLVAGDAIRLTSTTGTVISDSILTALVPATVSSAPIIKDIAVSPDGAFAYATNSQPIGNFIKFNGYYSNQANLAIYQYSVGGNGALSPLSPANIAAFSTGAQNFQKAGYKAKNIIFSSDGISAYVTCLALYYPTTVEYRAVAHLSFGTDGLVSVNDFLLTASSTYPSNYELGGITISTDTGHEDEFVYTVDPTSGNLYQFQRNLGTGELTALSPASISVGVGCQDIVLSDDGLFGYVTNSTTNSVTILSRVTSTGLMTVSSTKALNNIGPTSLKLATEANNPYLYVVCNVSGKIELYSRNSSTGALTYVNAYSVGVSPQKMVITGESVYVTNASDNTISMFVRNSTSGALTPTSTATISTGTSPLGIAISPSGNSVYACNSGAGTISQYSRNATADLVGLPTGLQELTTYYVISAGLSADSFRVSETEGGTAVATSGQQAGVHTYTTLGYGFPEGAKTVSYMNGRFVALEPNTQNFYVSEVLDGKWWDALNVQTVDSNPDNVVGEIVSHNELIVFCDDSGEVFYDSGTTPSPFVRNVSGIFEVGCRAPYSIATIDNQVFWLGGDKSGGGIVYKLQGFSPIRISTHSIEYEIQQMDDYSDARAFAYQQDGHHFYVLTFPTGDKTYVFDVNTGLWHERANFADGVYHRWEAQEMAFFAGKHLVLDHSEGKIYSISPTTYAYGTEVRKWVRSFRVPTNDMNRTRHTRLQLDCEVGVGLQGEDDPQVVMRFSDDGGHTWSNERWESMGAIGEYHRRVVWHRLGMTKGQPRIYELSGTDPVKITLLNVHLD